MKADITQLLCFFDELLPLTNKEQKIYWFRTCRSDGIVVTLTASFYESRAIMSIYNEAGIAITGFKFSNCSEIRVLDEKRKCLEVLHNNGNGRCFLSLLNNPILDYTN